MTFAYSLYSAIIEGLSPPSILIMGEGVQAPAPLAYDIIVLDDDNE